MVIVMGEIRMGLVGVIRRVGNLLGLVGWIRKEIILILGYM